MSIYLITLTKQQVEEAVLAYVNKRVTIRGRKEMYAPSLFFSNKDGDIGYFTCAVECKDSNPTEGGQ